MRRRCSGVRVSIIDARRSDLSLEVGDTEVPEPLQFGSLARPVGWRSMA